MIHSNMAISNKKKHSLTHVNIKLPDVFMKKDKWETEIENLYPQEPSKPVLQNLTQN